LSGRAGPARHGRPTQPVHLTGSEVCASRRKIRRTGAGMESSGRPRVARGAHDDDDGRANGSGAHCARTAPLGPGPSGMPGWQGGGLPARRWLRHQMSRDCRRRSPSQPATHLGPLARLVPAARMSSLARRAGELVGSIIINQLACVKTVKNNGPRRAALSGRPQNSPRVAPTRAGLPGWRRRNARCRAADRYKSISLNWQVRPEWGAISS
jgi:hypothetical protein